MRILTCLHTCKNNSAFTVTVVIRMILEKKYEYMIEKVIKKNYELPFFKYSQTIHSTENTIWHRKNMFRIG